MTRSTLPPARRMRVITVGFSAAIALYALVVFVAEPLRSFAVDTESVVVELIVAEVIGVSCDGTDGNTSFGSGETVSIGTITFTGDTGAYSNARAAFCYVKTNDGDGYTLGWHVASGSGGTRTGYLINQFEDSIAPFGAGSGNTTATWSVATNDARWGGRVSSTSSGSSTGPYDFGTDASSEKWARVKTGSTVAIRRSTSETQNGSGDLIRIGFRAEIGATKVQPTGTYRSTVFFTATTL